VCLCGLLLLIAIPIIKTCIEQTQSYCCFNSRLAKIINEQGRGQVGKTWGSGENPDCSGFTTAEFEQLDFSRIDMSEFIQEVASSVRMPDVSLLRTERPNHRSTACE
jgi:conjugal transfer mating pair stabilization protein TraN